MATKYAMKGAGLTMGKCKALAMPEVEMTIFFEDRSLGKMTDVQRGTFDAQFEKLFKAKSTETLDKAERKVRDWGQLADKKIPTEDERGAQATIAAVQKDLERLCKDLQADLKKVCAGSVWMAYTTAMNAKMVGQIDVTGEVGMSGKVQLSSEAVSSLATAANAQEIAGKVLGAYVYPIQDDVEGVVGESQRAAPMLDKSIKECTLLSKVMKEQIKKPTPEGGKIIKLNQVSLDKNLDMLEKLVSGSLTRTRQAKMKLGKLESVTKELKSAAVAAEIRSCVGEAQRLLDLLNSFHGMKPVIDQIGKPFDGKAAPDFGKLAVVLHKLRDPKPSKTLEEGVTRLGEKLAAVAKG